MPRAMDRSAATPPPIARPPEPRAPYISTRTRASKMVEFVAWPLVIVAVALAIGAGAMSGQAPEQIDRVLLSDTAGAIRALAVHYTAETGEATLPTYVDLFRALPADRTVYVVVPAKRDFGLFIEEIAERGVEHRERFLPLIMGRPITPWARDRFIVRDGSPRSTILVPAEPTDSSSEERRGDWFVGFEFGRALPDVFHTVTTPLRFDGGDQFCTGGWMYVDANLLAKNVPAVFPDRDTLIGHLAEISGYPRERIELIGNSPDEIPNHHVCMYMGAVPGGPLMVADATPDGIDTAPAYAALRARGISASYSADFARRCDFVADWLTSRGHKVARVPIFPCEDPKTWVTYTNVLSEERTAPDGTRSAHVYLPVFGEPGADRAGEAAWVAHGVTIHRVDVSKIYMHRGALRCLTLPLSRE